MKSTTTSTVRGKLATGYLTDMDSLQVIYLIVAALTPDLFQPHGRCINPPRLIHVGFNPGTRGGMYSTGYWTVEGVRAMDFLRWRQISIYNVSCHPYPDW